MIKVLVDDSPFQDFANVKTMGDLVELVKVSIDPNTIITGITIDGKELSEVDWRVPLSVQGDSTLEIITGSREDYLRVRLESAGEYLQHISKTFSLSRVSFKEGENQEANKTFGVAVNDLKAFIDWYHALLLMFPSSWDVDVSKFEETVTELVGTCEGLVQQQLYQAWWAIGEQLENKLEPTLAKLLTHIEKISEEVQSSC